MILRFRVNRRGLFYKKYNEEEETCLNDITGDKSVCRNEDKSSEEKQNNSNLLIQVARLSETGIRLDKCRIIDVF